MTESACPSLRVLISGGAGGVGLACANAMAAYQPELILCDLDGPGLTAAANWLRAFTRHCDATAEHSVAIFAEEITQKFSSVDVLINAAGEGYARTLSTMRMTRALMPLLRRAGGQRLIVNIAPTFVSSANPLFPHASSPTAFKRVSDAIAEQARGSGIEVAHISPSTGPRLPRDVRAVKLPAGAQGQENDYAAAQVVALVEAVRLRQGTLGSPIRKRCWG